ncbi:hypothetical protein Trydic_g585 [Trypoxylus dichotomus]
MDEREASEKTIADRCYDEKSEKLTSAHVDQGVKYPRKTIFWGCSLYANAVPIKGIMNSENGRDSLELKLEAEP